MDLQEELQKKEEIISQQQLESIQYIKTIEDLSANQLVLEKEIGRQKNNIANYENELKDLQLERNAFDKHISQLQVEIESYEKQIILLNQDLKLVRNQCDDALQSLKDIQKTHEIELQSLYDSQQIEKEKLLKQIDDSVEATKQTFSDVVSQLENQIQTLNLELEAAEIKNKEFQQVTEKLQNEVNQLTINEKKLIQDIQQQQEQLSDRANQQEQQHCILLEQKDDEIQKLKSEVNQILGKYAEAEQQVKNIQLQLQESQDKQNLNCQQFSQDKEILNAELHQQQVNYEQQLEELKEYIVKQEEEYGKQFEILEKEIIQWKIQVDSLSLDNSSAKKSILNFEMNLSELQKQNSLVNDQNKFLANQLEEAKQSLVIQQQQYQQQQQLYQQQLLQQQQLMQQQQQHTQQSQNLQATQATEKMVTIPMKELLNWDKRSKDQQSQIKALTNEIQQVKNQQEEQTKIQNSKQMKSSLSIEGMAQKCAALQQIIDDTSQQNSKLTLELSQIKQQNQQLKEDYGSTQLELKELRQIASDKFKIEGELQQALMQISEHKDQSKKMNEITSNYENCQEQLETTRKTLKQSEQLRVNVQNKLEDTANQLLKINLELQNVKQERDQKGNKLKDLEKLLSSQFEEYSSLELKHKDQCTINEDMKNQVKILQKKYSHETEWLKDDCQLKQKQIALLEECNKSLTNDLQNLRELQFRQKAPETPLTKKERIVVESLSMRVQELELENKKTKDLLCGKIMQLQTEIEQKINYFNKIAALLAKNCPSLTEVDSLDKEDVKMIQQTKKKPNIQEILEKTLIENLSLREQLKILGAELNKRK